MITASIISLVTGLVAGLAAWFGANFIGQPILALRAKRREAFQIAERYSWVNHSSSVELRQTALRSLHDVGNVFLAYHRENALATRAYCWLFKYDLELAAQLLFGLAEGPRGEFAMRPDQRKNTVDAIYYSLGATRHLSPEEITTVRREIEASKCEVKSE